MKKLKPNQRHGCSFCKVQGLVIQAVWRGQSMSLTRYACDDHRQTLADVEKAEREQDSRMTEADYQSWYNQ